MAPNADPVRPLRRSSHPGPETQLPRPHQRQGGQGRVQPRTLPTRPPLLGRADLEDPGATDRTRPFCRRTAVLHGDLLCVLDIALGLAFHAVSRCCRRRHLRSSSTRRLRKIALREPGPCSNCAAMPFLGPATSRAPRRPASDRADYLSQELVSSRCRRCQIDRQCAEQSRTIFCKRNIVASVQQTVWTSASPCSPFTG